LRLPFDCAKLPQVLGFDLNSGVFSDTSLSRLDSIFSVLDIGGERAPNALVERALLSASDEEDLVVPPHEGADELAVRLAIGQRCTRKVSVPLKLSESLPKKMQRSAVSVFMTVVFV